MRHAQRITCVLLLVLLAGASVSARAQQVQGSLTGTATDASGGVVPGVRVTAIDKDTGFTRSAVSGHDGVYLIPLLPPGQYTLTAEKQGFEKYSEGPITLTVDQQAKVDILLTVGAASTTVSVEAVAPVLDTQTYSVGTTVEEAKVEQLPFNGRQFLQATLFTPGVVPGTQGSELNSNRGGSINVNGMRETMNTYLLDGMSDTSIAVGTYSATPPLDSIQEFRMETGVYDAKFGNTPGAQVNMVTKSGTNQFHGSLYEYLRNNDLDARNYFEPTVPPFHRNQFGAALGGPISIPSVYNGHDRTFFFVNYEGLRDLHSFYGRAHVPDTNELNGDFSELLPSAQCTTGRTVLLDPLILFNPQAPLQVPYNMVNLLSPSFPSGTVDPVGRGLAGLYPKPNLSTGPCGGENYTAVVERKVYTNDYVGRFDHRWGSKDTAFYRYNLSTDSEFSPSGLPTGLPGFGTYRDDWFTQTGIDWTHTFSGTLLNEAKFGYNRWQYRWFTQDQGNPISSQLGLRGLPSAARDIGIPNLSFAGFDGMGSDTSFPQAGAVNTFEYGDTLTQIHGNHSLAYGFQFRQIKRGNFYEDIRARGQYDFTGVVTGELVLEGIAQDALLKQDPTYQNILFNPQTGVPTLFQNPQGQPCLPTSLVPAAYGGSAQCGPIANFGNGVADALFGIPQDWIDGSSGYISGTGSEYDGFAQDTWKARPNLTATFGVRYEFNSLVTDKYNHIAGFDYNTNVCGVPGAVLVAGTSSATLDCFQSANTQTGEPVGTFVSKGTVNLGSSSVNRALQRPDRNNFGPRIGFAWQPFHDSKTVIRSGAGVYYDQMVGELYFQKSFNPPFFNLLEGNLLDNETAALTALATPPSAGGLPLGTGLFLQNLFTSSALAGALFPTSNPVIINLQDATVYQWSFDVQRELGSSWLLDIGYVGTRGLHLPFEWDPNQADNSNPSACTVNGTGCPRPYPGSLGQSYTDSSGKSIYHSLQAKLERHYTNGLAVIAAYTYGKALDTNSTYFSSNASGNFPENSYNRAAEKGRADFDYRHRLSMAYIYDVPLGKTVAHLQNSKLNYLIEGWQLAGIAMLQSGAPYSVSVSGNPSQNGDGNDRPNVVLGAPLYPAHKTVNQWALASAFSTPAQFTYGNAGRDTLIGPGEGTWDFSLIRQFKLTESKQLEFRAEMFNVLNRPNFSLPDGNISDTTFGVVGNTVQPIAGQASGGPGDPREIQFALRLRF
ncbi:MAG: carboxypeptidase regulatory-like domain-containing protein [Terriglobia bacterium]